MPTTPAVAETPTWDRVPDVVEVPVEVVPAEVEILADAEIAAREDTSLVADASAWTADIVIPSEPDIEVHEVLDVSVDAPTDAAIEEGGDPEYLSINEKLVVSAEPAPPVAAAPDLEPAHAPEATFGPARAPEAAYESAAAPESSFEPAAEPAMSFEPAAEPTSWFGPEPADSADADADWAYEPDADPVASFETAPVVEADAEFDAASESAAEPASWFDPGAAYADSPDDEPDLVASVEVSPVADDQAEAEAEAEAEEEEEDVELVEREVVIEPVRRPVTDIWVADDSEQHGSDDGHAGVELTAETDDRAAEMTDADAPSDDVEHDVELAADESDAHADDAFVPDTGEVAPVPDPIASAERFARDLAATYAELDEARDAARAANAAKRAVPRQPGDKAPDVRVLSGPLADV